MEAAKSIDTGLPNEVYDLVLVLQQAAAVKNGQNSAVMGAGQMPSDGAPAAPAPAPAPVAPPAPSP